MNDNVLSVKVWGEYACFTRPDLKVERMTYPCMTPSAARGVLDSILWKPEFKWHIHRIRILKPVRFFSIKRNELNKKQWRDPIVVEEARAQRNSIVLRDVAYIIEASIESAKSPVSNPARKYSEIFNRRIRKGQCWRRPFLGTREFAAEFGPPDISDSPIPQDINIGSMFLDMWYRADGVPVPKFFFNVAVKQGILDCSSEHEELLGSAHPRAEVAIYPQQLIHEFNVREAENDREEL
jgi:CRISPR-associated protein Cas5d